MPGIPVLATVLLMAVGGSPGCAHGEEQGSARTRPRPRVVWEATLLALRKLAIPVASAARSEGRITSVYVPLDALAAEKAVDPTIPQPPAGWGEVEYRYVIEVEDRQARATLRVTAEIRLGPAADAERRLLTSSRALELAFREALSPALVEVLGG